MNVLYEIKKQISKKESRNKILQKHANISVKNIFDVAGVKKKRKFVIVRLEHRNLSILRGTEKISFSPKLNVQT
jgi:hypothetical protein